VHIGVDKDSGLIQSVETTAANAHELTPPAELLHDDEEVDYTDAAYQGIGKRPEMAGRNTGGTEEPVPGTPSPTCLYLTRRWVCPFRKN
jgi:IS5 family transposase